MINFEVGKTYVARSICDHDCVYRMEVLKRTAKTITVRMNGGGATKLLRPGVYDGAEYVKPNGSYSMALIVRASKLEVVS
jgi:hypothetical protein